MNLVRLESNAAGIFGELYSDDGSFIAVTLEHAYQDALLNWGPKIPCGTFKCIRGQHRLHSMTEDFTTFEITGIEGHSKILFHWGNFNKDSDGCVLLGEHKIDKMITNSRTTFEAFMNQLTGANEFILVVE